MTAKNDSDPPLSDSEWDAAETVAEATSRETPVDTPRVAPVPKAGPPPMPVATPTPSPVAVTKSPSVPPPAVTSPPGPNGQGLSAPMREEVWAIVRAAVAEITQPMMAKQRDLEARLERAERGVRTEGAAARPEAAVRAPAAPAEGEKSRSIPVSLGVSLAPAMRVSIPPGTYGVAVLDPGPKPAAVDTTGVVLVEVPDFGGKSRMAPKLIAAVILLIVIGVLTMTVLSHT